MIRAADLPDPDDFEKVKLLRFDEVGSLLGCHEKTVRRFVREGRLLAVTLPGTSITRIPLTELRAFNDRLRDEARFGRQRRAG